MIRDGIIYPGPGWKAWRASGPAAAEGDPADDATMYNDDGFAILQNGDLLYGNDRQVVWRIRNALRGEALFQVPSEDGRLLYQFDVDGRHEATLDALTGVTVYDLQYDAGGLLVGIRDRDGDTTTVERDAGGSPTAIVSPFGQRTELAIDPNGYIASITNPAGEATSFTYGPEGLMATMTDARLERAIFLYDSMGHLTSDRDRAGGIQELTRIETGGLLQVGLTSPLDRTTLYESEEIDGNQLERRITDAATDVTTTVWHTNGGRTRTYPDGTVVVYDPEGDPRFGMLAPVPERITVTTPGGLVRTTTADRSVTLSDPYDPLSLAALVETTSVNGRTFTRSYDAATNRSRLTSAEGRTALFDLDALGRVVATAVGTLEPVVSTYDLHGRLETLTQGSGVDERTVTFAYDASGRLASIVDPLSQTTSFAYDAANRLVRQTLPGSEQIGFTYDPNGNLASLTPPDELAHGFGYTALDFEASYTPPDVGSGSPTTSTTYDLDRNVASVTRPGGEVVSFGYDPAGRVDSVIAAVGTTTLAYDGAGRLSSVTAPGAETLTFGYDGPLPIATSWSGSVTGTVTRGYDGSFRPSSEDVNGANTVTFAYDDDNLLTRAGALSITRDVANGFVSDTALGVVTTSRSHDGFGEMESEVASVSGGEIYRAEYVRDKLGRITRKTESIQGTSAVWEYTYDPSGRLLQVDKDGVPFGVYTYDDNGNRLTYTGTFGSATGSYDAQDRLLSYGSLTYTYTPPGELAAKSSGSAAVSYTYDAFGALRTVVLDSGVTIDYVIDGQGRRVGKRIDGVLVQGLLYADQLNPVAELDGSGAVVSRFVYGSRPNVPAYMEKGGATYRIVSDHLGSPRLVVDTATGAIAQRLDYDAFGRILLDTNPGFQPFGFAGGLYDPQTGLVRFGARDYDPEVGRWTAKDPIGFGGGDANLYAYVLGDPTNWTDSDGLYKTRDHWAITYYVAYVEGFTWGQAKTIADANRGMDQDWSTSPWNPFGGTEQHFGPRGLGDASYRSEISDDLWDAIRRCDLEAFGRHLHRWQDSYSHSGYHPPWGHWWTLLNNPDIYDDSSPRDQHMRWTTRQWLRRLHRRISP
ncbi:MAG: RHS repeat-associated core domain-containing protein [Thermoanaerobaculia bacterium]|nr:RHS repeat-associated core domain-containing protein [Thermoanaerobaculia bacterium]